MAKATTVGWYPINVVAPVTTVDNVLYHEDHVNSVQTPGDST